MERRSHRRLIALSPRGSTAFLHSLAVSLFPSAVFIVILSVFAALLDALERVCVCVRVRWPAPLRNGIKRRVSRILPLDARFVAVPRARWCVQRPRQLGAGEETPNLPSRTPVARSTAAAQPIGAWRSLSSLRGGKDENARCSKLRLARLCA